MITIVVDTHHLILEKGGTKRVTANLLKQFHGDPRIRIIELSPAYLKPAAKGWSSRLFVHLFRFFWVHVHLPVLCFLRKADILFSPEFNTPLFSSCKRVVIAHDAHTRAQKEYISTLWFHCYYVPFIEAAIRRADLIFTISEFAKKQIVALMELDEAKVKVAYNGIDPLFTMNTTKSLSERMLQLIKGEQYILFVGTFEARKNIERLLEAYSILKKKYPGDIKMVIAGQASSTKHSDRSRQIAHLIDKLCITDDVVMCGYLSDTELPILYRNAKLIAFPSLYEGFGLPILEGFASGVPVLTSTICSMPEIAGGAALLADPYKVDDLADKMALLLLNLPLREQLISKGKERVKVFTWQNCAEIYVSEMLKLLKN